MPKKKQTTKSTSKKSKSKSTTKKVRVKKEKRDNWRKTIKQNVLNAETKKKSSVSWPVLVAVRGKGTEENSISLLTSPLQETSQNDSKATRKKSSTSKRKNTKAKKKQFTGWVIADDE